MKRFIRYGGLVVALGAFTLIIGSPVSAAPPEGVAPDGSSQLAQCATPVGGQGMGDHTPMMDGQGAAGHAQMMDDGASGCDQINETDGMHASQFE